LCVVIGTWDDDDRSPFKNFDIQSKETLSDTETGFRDRVSAAEDVFGWQSRCFGTDLESQNNYIRPNTIYDDDYSGTDSDRDAPFWSIRHRLYESSDSYEMNSGDSWISDTEQDSDSQSDDEYLAI
jgi:hypothetical protein